MEKREFCARNAPGKWLGTLRTLYRESPGEFWHACLFWSFCLHLAFFPLGYGFREVMPVVNALFLALYYRHCWKQSVLRRLPVLPLFCCFWLMIILGVVFSTNRPDSFLHACMGLNKAYILPFIAMECVRSLKDLRRLVYACITALFWEGLDGIWQWWTGFDFIMGYPLHSGRLTSSLDDYWVGNYVALVLIPAFGFWYIMRRSYGFIKSLCLYCLVFWPAYFLFVGAAARAGLLALAGTFFLWLLFSRCRFTWAALIVPLVIGALFVLLQPRPESLSASGVIADGRWGLWTLAWAVFRAHPFFGAGIWQYNSAFRALGLVPTQDEITISHPHNIYLDLLCSHGLIGTTLGLIFLFGMVVWGLKHLLPQLRLIARGSFPEATGAEAGLPGRSALYWQLAGLFFMGYIAWLINGIFGHDFYRIWWLSLAMAHLGVAIGAIVRGQEGMSAAGGKSAGGRFPEAGARGASQQGDDGTPQI